MAPQNLLVVRFDEHAETLEDFDRYLNRVRLPSRRDTFGEPAKLPVEHADVLTVVGDGADGQWLRMARQKELSMGEDLLLRSDRQVFVVEELQWFRPGPLLQRTGRE